MKTTPVVARGDQYVLGQVTRDVAKFLGVNFDGGPPLTAPQLIEKADLVLAGLQRFIRQLPEEKFNDLLPMSGRKRTYRELSHHVVRIQEAMLEATAGITFTIEQPVKPPDESITHPDQVADYAAATLHRLRDWWAEQEKADPTCQQIVQTYFGEQPLAVLLERCTWHSAQHTRQLQYLLTRMGVEPDRPLSADDLKGLPLPEKVWED
ncbi:MAG: DinB family protein [Proteobacteria bacterium]|nr:DinB family protein [Burkholderiales bacterium]